MILNRYISFFVLFFLIIFSKEILVFNEEILVLFSFVVFFILFYKFVVDVSSLELDIRSTKIKEEFLFYKEMQEKTLVHLISYYNKQKFLSNKIKPIFNIMIKAVDFIIANSFLFYLKLLILDIDDKLRKLINNESKLVFFLQKKINLELFVYLCSIYSKGLLKVKDKKKSMKLNLMSILFISV